MKKELSYAYKAALEEILEGLDDLMADLEDIRDIAGALGMIPAQDAPQIEIDVPQPQQEQTQLSFWESIATFLAGLFA